jgi:hypothetical protein
VAGDGDGVAASTTIAAHGEESGSAAIVHLPSGITRGHPTTPATPDTAATGTIAHPTTVHPMPPARQSTARPRTIRETPAIAHPPINPAIVPQPITQAIALQQPLYRPSLPPGQLPRRRRAELVLRQTSQPRGQLPRPNQHYRTGQNRSQHRRTGQHRNNVQQIQAANQARANQRRNHGPRLTRHKASGQTATPALPPGCTTIRSTPQQEVPEPKPGHFQLKTQSAKLIALS